VCVTPDALVAAPSRPRQASHRAQRMARHLRRPAAAHGIAQDDDSRDAAWGHAHLHRVEGDVANAGYWYGCAGRPTATGPLDAEWWGLAEALLRGAATGP
jgi:hypothetical protein